MTISSGGGSPPPRNRRRRLKRNAQRDPTLLAPPTPLPRSSSSSIPAPLQSQRVFPPDGAPTHTHPAPRPSARSTDKRPVPIEVLTAPLQGGNVGRHGARDRPGVLTERVIFGTSARSRAGGLPRSAPFGQQQGGEKAQDNCRGSSKGSPVGLAHPLDPFWFRPVGRRRRRTRGRSAARIMNGQAGISALLLLLFFTGLRKICAESPDETASPSSLLPGARSPRRQLFLSPRCRGGAERLRAVQPSVVWGFARQP